MGGPTHDEGRERRLRVTRRIYRVGTGVEPGVREVMRGGAAGIEQSGGSSLQCPAGCIGSRCL